MYFRRIFFTGLFFFLRLCASQAQGSDSVFMLTATVYNGSFQAVPATHVINMNSHAGVVSDSLGIFKLPVRKNDTLLFQNIAYLDSLVPVALILPQLYIALSAAYYPLEEAMIFEWGSTYGDFKKAIIAMPNRQTLGASMGLPQQDPDYIPYDMDETVLKSAAFLFTSPLSYFYHKHSKHAKSNRKVFWLEKNREKHKVFDAIISQESIAEITGLTGDALLDFMSYLFQRMRCDFKCSEFQVYSEIHSHWKVYIELFQPDVNYP